MTDYNTTSGAGQLRLTVVQASQNITANQSTLNWSMALYCSNGTSWTATPIGWAVYINGVGYSGTYTFDFRVSSGQLIATGSTVVPHNADGTKTVTVQGYSDATGTAAIGGPINVGPASFGPLTRIPRGPKVEVSGSWQQSIAYVEQGGAWQTAIVFVEQGGAWVQAS